MTIEKLITDGSNENWGVRLAGLAVEELREATKVEDIKAITLKYWEPIRDALNDNSIKRVRTEFAKVLFAAFPCVPKNAPKPRNYYFTDSREGSYSKLEGEDRERYQHLSLWFATSNKDKWERLPDDTAPVEETVKTSNNIKTMQLEELELDTETAQAVQAALEHSQLSLGEFIQKACQVYANTINGKNKDKNEDLSAVETSELKSDKYKRHPGRAYELVRRAIYSLEEYNNKATEKAQKWHINQTAIQLLTGSKPSTIKEIIEENFKTRIEDHNAKHELVGIDNRKYNIKIQEVVQLVNSGLDV